MLTRWCWINRGWIRWSWTLAILVSAVLLFGDIGTAKTLSRLPLDSLIYALLLSVIQVLVSAWRWQYTARRLGLFISFPLAVREYYLATFINQVLPGGVLGDAHRAVRHGLASERRSDAVHAVMIERLSGQCALILLALITWFWMPPMALDTLSFGSWQGWLAVLSTAGLVVWALGAFFRQWLAGFRRAIWQAFLVPRVLSVQLISSLVIVLSYLGVFLILADGMVLTMPPGVLLPCVLGLLLAMTVPVTVAGWGVREGAAGLLWMLAGYPTAEGVALSIAYGIIFLISSLPGVLFIFSRSYSTA